MATKPTKTKCSSEHHTPEVPQLPDDIQVRLLNANMEKIIGLLEKILEKQKQGLFDVSRWYK